MQKGTCSRSMSISRCNLRHWCLDWNMEHEVFYANTSTMCTKQHGKSFCLLEAFGAHCAETASAGCGTCIKDCNTPDSTASSADAGSVDASQVSGICRADVPTSAIDFHVSSIAAELIQHPSINAAAQATASQVSCFVAVYRTLRHIMCHCLCASSVRVCLCLHDFALHL